jgi:hypothetical protein
VVDGRLDALTTDGNTVDSDAANIGRDLSGGNLPPQEQGSIIRFVGRADKRLQIRVVKVQGRDAKVAIVDNSS